MELTQEEIKVLRSKILTIETNPGKGHHFKHGYKVFTEKGLYMLATILKGDDWRGEFEKLRSAQFGKKYPRSRNGLFYEEPPGILV